MTLPEIQAKINAEIFDSSFPKCNLGRSTSCESFPTAKNPTIHSKKTDCPSPANSQDDSVDLLPGYPSELVKYIRRNHNASDKLRGYIFQIESAILDWVNLDQDSAIFLEASEDYDSISRDNLSRLTARLIQAKHVDNGATLIEQNVFKTLVHAGVYFEQQLQDGNTHRVIFIYLSTQRPGIEKNTYKLLEKKPGILVWNELHDDSTATVADPRILEIYHFFQQDLTNLLATNPRCIHGMPVGDGSRFQKFVFNIYNLFFLIKHFKFYLQSPSGRSIEKKIVEVITTAYQLTEKSFIWAYLFNYVTRRVIVKYASQKMEDLEKRKLTKVGLDSLIQKFKSIKHKELRTDPDFALILKLRQLRQADEVESSIRYQYVSAACRSATEIQLLKVRADQDPRILPYAVSKIGTHASYMLSGLRNVNSDTDEKQPPGS